MTGEEVIKCFVQEEVQREAFAAGEIRVDTPLGTLIASAAKDPEHPGIYVDLRRPDESGDISLALVEFSADDADFPDGDKNIITRVWGNARQEDYTIRTVHQNIGESAKEEEGYIVLCYSTQALSMIVDLGNGPTTESGDRSSQYFIIAKGRQHIDRTVSVALIENTHGLPEGEGYYTLHLVDDVSGDPCELYHTDDLSEDSLVGLLGEILDDLDKGGRK